MFAAIAVFILTIIGIQIFTFNISYDEAFTYLSYSKYDKFFDMFLINLANNHFLNSFLIYFTSLFAPFSSVAIRLPIFVFGTIYFILSAIVSTKFRNSLLCFGLLTCYYFFISHFAMARGYGMAATLVLAGLSYLISEKNKLQNHYTALVILIIACLANFASFSILIALITYLWLFEYNRKLIVFSKKRNIFLAVSIVLIAIIFLNISKDGKPLFGAYDQPFTEAVTLYYLNTLIPFIQFPVLVAYLVEVFFIVYLIFMLIRFPHKVKFGFILGINFGIIYLSSHFLHKPYPTARVLVPYWSLIVLAVLECIEFITTKLSVNKWILTSFNMICLMGLLYAYGTSITFKESVFKDSQEVSLENDMINNLHIADHIDKDIRPDVEFYLRKGKFYNTIPSTINNLKPDTVIKTKYETVRFYKEKKIVSIYLPNNYKDNSYSYTLNFNDSSSIAKAINTELFEYNFNDSICRIIILPCDTKLLKHIDIFNNKILIASPRLR